MGEVNLVTKTQGHPLREEGKIHFDCAVFMCIKKTHKQTSYFKNILKDTLSINMTIVLNATKGFTLLEE